jgi:hypothetical protein
VFLEGIEKVEGVHHNKPISKKLEHVVMDEVVNDDELVKDANLDRKTSGRRGG